MLELGLVGAGSMGANHGRVAMGLRDARLTAIADVDPDRGETLAQTVGASYCRDPADLVGKVDAVIIAAPTATHADLSCAFLDAGVHVLVEKPIASTAPEAETMISAARRSGRILMVGHVERFNPAVLELSRLVTDPVHVTTERISPFTPRIEEGVTLDLMIHDLDIVSSIAASELRSASAVSRDLHGSDDLSVALLEFESGLTASVLASRLGQDKVRTITITEPDRVIRADLIRQSVTIHRLGEVDQAEGGAGYLQRGIVEIPFLRSRGEPLLLQLGHFIDCILNEEGPLVDGDAGLRAITLVEQVRAAARASRRGTVE